MYNEKCHFFLGAISPISRHYNMSSHRESHQIADRGQNLKNIITFNLQIGNKFCYFLSKSAHSIQSFLLNIIVAEESLVPFLISFTEQSDSVILDQGVPGGWSEIKKNHVNGVLIKKIK